MTTPRNRKNRRRAEYFFLPPLQMVLSTTDNTGQQDEKNGTPAERRKGPDPEIVARLIEKLSRKDE